MSSTHQSFSSHGLPRDLGEMCSNNLEHFLRSQSQSQEEKAIAASIDELDESTYLSSSQQAALETLQDFDDSRVLNLLSAIPLPDHVHYPSHTGLSSEKVDALLKLRTCPKTLILLWRRNSRGLQQNSY